MIESAIESPIASWNPSFAPDAEQERLLVVGPLVHVVAKLMMQRGKVVRVDVQAQLHPQVVDVIDVPGGRMAHDLAIARLGKHATASRSVSGSGAKPSDV